jgi:TRAP-type C4-dicarboxylate transport system permease small subunit
MKLRNILDSALEKVLIALMAVMVVDVLWQVLAGYFPALPSSFTDELARFLLIWVGLLGAAYATGKKMHLALELIFTRLNALQTHRLRQFIYGLTAVFAALVMVIGGIRLIFITLSLGQTAPALGIPLGYVYVVLPLSGVLIVYYSLIGMFERQPASSSL